jgi:cytochrome c551/c552
MEVMKQASPLTMGWCINCHRETDVKMEGNGYYKDLHEKFKKQYGPDAKLTVDKIGGLECARCHY